MENGLGNEGLLAKIDKLRKLNVSSMIPLPQILAPAPSFSSGTLASRADDCSILQT